MEIKVTKVPEQEPERIWIQCHEVTSEVAELVRFAKAIQGTLTGECEENQYEICVTDILYVESVDEKTFLYTPGKVYASRQRLYEIEQMLSEKSFLRISKSVVVNLMKIRGIKPAMNGRFSAKLTNDEEVIISRKYVPELKAKIKGGKKS